MNLLTQVVTEKRTALDRRKSRAYTQEIRSKVSDADTTRGFGGVLRRESGRLPKLIAELKKASPSKGIIREDFHPVEIAQIYENGGASALSVLTEERYFLGSPDYLGEIRQKVSLPILQKDFIIDEIQVYEARAWGADAILLIAAILEVNQIKDYFDLARDLSLDVLVEIHSEKELARVAEWAPILGINNRDLTTFETSLETTFRILPEVPADCIIVSESGIRTQEELVRLSEAGVHAVLIGETLMASEKIEAQLKALMGDG